METMFLVAGLAVAGLVGIAAAFYFSIRSGNRGDKRLRSAGSGRTGAGRAGAARRPGGRNSTARPDLTGHSPRTANGGRPVTTFRPAAVSSRNSRAKADTGPDPVADFDPVPAGGRRAAPAATAADSWPGDPVSDDSWPGGAWPDDPMPGDPAATDPGLGAVGSGGREAGESRSAARLSRDAHAAESAARTAKQRRRVGFRKGADLDEELWPAETFGGVSDEQFWDDLASDKPLATTARTAQQAPPSRNRPLGAPPGTGLKAGLDTGPATDPQAVQAQGTGRKRDDRAPGGGRRGAGSGAYPAPRTGPDPAAERTAIQPAYAATQPVQSMKPPLPGATQPVRVTPGSGQPMSAASQSGAGSRPRESGTPPRGVASQPRESATPPRGVATQPRESATQPAETRRRRPSSAEEDPLTSSAFSLRPSGPVDGRSSLRGRNASADRYETGGSTGSNGGTSPYPYSTPSFADPSSVTQTMSTPPYGQDYEYGRRGSAAPAGEPRRQNGTGSHARPDSTGEGTRPARQAYPRDSNQANGGSRGSGSYPGNGYPGNGYPGNGHQAGSYPVGGYPGNGHRGNGHRAPYDPRDDYRRLTHQR
jgi:hypothetical protein